MAEKLVTVRMRAFVNGYRNGEEWPQPGSTIDLPSDEAANLVRMGLADAVGGPRRSASVETADAEPAETESSVLTTRNARGGR